MPTEPYSVATEGALLLAVLTGGSLLVLAEVIDSADSAIFGFIVLAFVLAVATATAMRQWVPWAWAWLAGLAVMVVFGVFGSSVWAVTPLPIAIAVGLARSPARSVRLVSLVYAMFVFLVLIKGN